ncbi:hypothetical protein Tco_0573219 [Tanacetum coccineum]
MCMFALTVSIVEPKNIKEAMANSAWIEAMQEELHQFDRLQVWELVDNSFGRRTTEYQLADMFTKALPEERFQYLVRRIGMRCLTPAELEFAQGFINQHGDYLVVYRVNGHFRAFNYLMKGDLKIMIESSIEENDQGDFWQQSTIEEDFELEDKDWKDKKKQKRSKTDKKREKDKEQRARQRNQPEITAGSARHSQTQSKKEIKEVKSLR